jgi:hypothetical protein
MITLAFLICLPNGQCFSNSPEIVFANKEQCEVIAQELILNNKEAAYRGEVPPHVAYFQCVEWGEPA